MGCDCLGLQRAVTELWLGSKSRLQRAGFNGLAVTELWLGSKSRLQRAGFDKLRLPAASKSEL
eukprot:1158322-Pelagomonas_calceolata.AAC.7